MGVSCTILVHMCWLQLNRYILLVCKIATQSVVPCHEILKHMRNNSETAHICVQVCWCVCGSRTKRRLGEHVPRIMIYTHTSQPCPFRLMRSQSTDWQGYGVTSLLSLTLSSSVSLRPWLIGAKEGTQGRPSGLPTYRSLPTPQRQPS